MEDLAKLPIGYPIRRVIPIYHARFLTKPETGYLCRTRSFDQGILAARSLLAREHGPWTPSATP
jgi:hypothetical protein